MRPASSAPFYVCSDEGALRQGEVLSDLVQIRAKLSDGDATVREVAEVRHAFALILTQDCDLDLDFKSRFRDAIQSKMIPSILFCEVIEASGLKGTEGINPKIWSQIKKNDHNRYQFLQAVGPTEDSLEQGLPELGIDFKRYFTLPTDEVYRRLDLGTKRRCRLETPYREHLTTRFFSYQARIALPEPHFSEP